MFPGYKSTDRKYDYRSETPKELIKHLKVQTPPWRLWTLGSEWVWATRSLDTNRPGKWPEEALLGWELLRVSHMNCQCTQENGPGGKSQHPEFQLTSYSPVPINSRPIAAAGSRKTKPGRERMPTTYHTPPQPKVTPSWGKGGGFL